MFSRDYTTGNGRMHLKLVTAKKTIPTHPHNSRHHTGPSGSGLMAINGSIGTHQASHVTLAGYNTVTRASSTVTLWKCSRLL